MHNHSVEGSTNLSAILLKSPIDGSIRRDFYLGSQKIENVYDLHYDRSHIKVTFFPRNAVPCLPNIDSPQFVFMPPQPWINPQKWTFFNSGITDNTVVIQDDEQLPSSIFKSAFVPFYICAYPISLLSAAITINPDNPQLKALRDSFRSTIKPPAYGEFIDLVIAGKFIDQEGKLKPSPDFEGEILMLNGLLGNQRSVLELLRRKTILEQMEQTSPSNAALDVSNNSNLQLKDLVMVHATGYLPYVDSNRVYLRTRFDGSQEAEARTSIHFSLNHHVVSHKQGHWEQQPYVLIASVEDMIKFNGAPYAFRPEDAYYLLSPGDALTLPPTTVFVRPYDEQNSTEIPLPTIRYGFRKFTKEDLATISAEWGNIFVSKNLADISQDRSSSLLSPSTGPSWIVFTAPNKYGTLEEFIQARLRFSEESQSNYLHIQSESKGNILTRGRARFRDLIRSLRIMMNQDVLDRLIWTQASPVISKPILLWDYDSIRKDLEENLGFFNKTLTVDRIIRQLGFRVQYIDIHYLIYEDYGDVPQNPPEVTEVLALAVKSGFSIVRNPKTIDGDLDQCLFYMKRALVENDDKYGLNPYEKRQYIKAMQESVRKKFLAATPQMRRMIYLTGGAQIGDYYL